MRKKMNDASSYPGTSHNYLNQTAAIIFLIIILFFSAWVRFNGITQQGISSGDSIRNISEAKLWATGQPPKFAGRFYRPVTFFLQGMALKIFGYNDYSIKILHGLMDMINILLIFLIAFMSVKNLWVGVVSSLLYAFLPHVISYTRSEMLYVESAIFVLLALFFFILFDNQKKSGFNVYLLLFLSGLNSGLAANTHADLAFLAPGYILYLFIKSYDAKNKKESLKQFLIWAFIFSFSFFIPYFFGFLLFGAKRVVHTMLREGALAKWNMDNVYVSVSSVQLFWGILINSLKFYFGKQFFLIGILLISIIFIIIYRKIKKESDPLKAYLPLMLLFSYVFLYSCFFNSTIACERYFMPLLPLVILLITLWYYTITKQFFGKHSVMVFICMFSILFLLNPKQVMPGKRKYLSPYRGIYDILKDEVNSKNKLLIAPVIIYVDRGFQLDLYFGRNAVYMCHLPFNNLNKEYNLKSLTELLAGLNIRFIFVGRTIDRRLLDPDTPTWKRCKNWYRKDASHYSLEKDLEIIQAYIKSKGGMVINMNRFGDIYYLSGKEVEQKQNLISNGSFEHWWRGFPMGKWKLVTGKISKSVEATEGSSSICFEPDAKNGSRIIRVFKKPLYKNGAKLRVCLDAKAGDPGKFIFYFSAYVKGKWKTIEPGVVRYRGNGDWVTLSEDFAISPDMKEFSFNLRLLPGAEKPAFVDNLHIEPLNIKR
jgi:hypothetical protein